MKLIALLLLLPVLAVAQSPTVKFTPFSVDTAFLFQAHPTTGMPGQLELRMFENDSLVFCNFDSTKKFPVLLYPEWQKDTLNVLGNVGLFSGFGFGLRLVADQGQVFNVISNDDMEMYKLYEQDSTYRAGLYIPCPYSKLTLKNVPAYTTGEEISGFVELSGMDFFEKSDLGTGNDRYRMEIRSSFQFLVPARQ